MRITQVHVIIKDKAHGIQFEYVAVPGAAPGTEDNPDDVIHNLLLRGQRLMQDHIDSVYGPRELAGPCIDADEVVEENCDLSAKQNEEKQ